MDGLFNIIIKNFSLVGCPFRRIYIVKHYKTSSFFKHWLVIKSKKVYSQLTCSSLFVLLVVREFTIILH